MSDVSHMNESQTRALDHESHKDLPNSVADTYSQKSAL